MTSLENGQEGDFFTYAQGLRVNSACTAAIIHRMFYVSIHDFYDQDTNLKLQYMTHNIKIYKTMIQSSIFFFLL